MAEGGGSGQAFRKRIRRAVAVHRSTLVAGVAFLAIFTLASWKHWPFNETPPKLGNDSSVWRFLVSERLTLGFVRLAVSATAAFLFASVFVLMAHNRWIVKLSPTGATTEELDKARTTIRGYEEQVKQLTKERDEYRGMVEVETKPNG